MIWQWLAFWFTDSIISLVFVEEKNFMNHSFFYSVNTNSFIFGSFSSSNKENKYFSLISLQKLSFNSRFIYVPLSNFQIFWVKDIKCSYNIVADTKGQSDLWNVARIEISLFAQFLMNICSEVGIYQAKRLKSKSHRLLKWVWFCLWRHSLYNGYHCRKWTRQPKFKSWMRLLAFHMVLIPWEKIWIQLFSLYE